MVDKNSLSLSNVTKFLLDILCETTWLSPNDFQEIFKDVPCPETTFTFSRFMESSPDDKIKTAWYENYGSTMLIEILLFMTTLINEINNRSQEKIDWNKYHITKERSVEILKCFVKIYLISQKTHFKTFELSYIYHFLTADKETQDIIIGKMKDMDINQINLHLLRENIMPISPCRVLKEIFNQFPQIFKNQPYPAKRFQELLFSGSYKKTPLRK